MEECLIILWIPYCSKPTQNCSLLRPVGRKKTVTWWNNPTCGPQNQSQSKPSTSSFGFWLTSTERLAAFDRCVRHKRERHIKRMLARSCSRFGSRVTWAEKYSTTGDWQFVIVCHFHGRKTPLGVGKSWTCPGLHVWLNLRIPIRRCSRPWAPDHFNYEYKFEMTVSLRLQNRLQPQLTGQYWQCIRRCSQTAISLQ